MLHRVRNCKYTTPQPVQIPAEVDRERDNVVTGGTFGCNIKQLDSQLGTDNYSNCELVLYLCYLRRVQLAIL